MVNTVVMGRSLLSALLLALLAPCAIAQTTGRSAGGPATGGDADFGLLILFGLIGFVVLVAWVISRMGDDGGRGPDHTIL
jgi:hypothetical protein